MSDHTPAPWKVIPILNGYNDKVCAIAEEAEGGSIIAQMLNLPEQEANARLIAAAPELLELLQEIFDGLSFDQDASIETIIGCVIYAQARAEIGIAKTKKES